MAGPFELLAREGRLPADRVCVRWRGRDYSFDEVVRAADRLAATLRGAGVAPRTAVVARVPSTPVGLVMLDAIWAVGAVAVPVDPGLPDDDFARLVDQARPAVVVRASNDEASLVPQVVARAGVARLYDDAVALVTTESHGAAARVMVDDASVLGWADTQWRAVHGDPPAADGLAARAPTAVVIARPLARSDTVLDVVAAARGGASVALVDPFAADDLADAVREHGVTAANLDPTAIEALLDDSMRASLEPLRVIRSGTEPVSASTARALRDRFGVTVLTAYGTAGIVGEATGWSALDARVHGDARLGARGRAHDGVGVSIVLPDGRDAAPDEPGEVRVHSPFRTRPDPVGRGGTAARLDPADRVRTGDVGRLDADGFLWIHDLSTS